MRPASGHTVLMLLVTGLSAIPAAAQAPATDPAVIDPFAPAPSFSARYQRFAVAADHPIASAAGAEILGAGGNAVDAAVATSVALSVVRPYSCGIGGGGFMIIRLRDDPKRGNVLVALNYREKAPGATTPDMYDRDDDTRASTRGGRAIGVPGTVAGLLYAHEKYGTLPLSRVLLPAIRVAQAGFEADQHYVDNARDEIRAIRETPGASDRFAYLWSVFLKNGELKVGDRISLPGQAEAFDLIARSGANAFYDGPIGQAILRATNSDRGVITADDLRDFGRSGVREVPPLAISFRGLTAITMPPPSSGGVVLGQVFGMLDARPDLLDPAVRAGPASVEYIHLMTEASKHAFADRARYLADPDAVRLPMATLLSAETARSRGAQIDPARTLPTDQYGTANAPPDDGGTSHFSVVDAWGGSVACTETINLVFGSWICVPEYGFALNNQMDDFQTRADRPNAFGLVQAVDNRPAPGRRPLSSMTPLIVVKPDPGRTLTDGAVRLTAGASGGPRIISGALQAALRVILFDDDAGTAVSAPRFHHQWKPDVLELERGFAEADALLVGLGSRGHSCKVRGEIGNVQLIRAVDSGWEAASDPRKGGRPAGR